MKTPFRKIISYLMLGIVVLPLVFAGYIQTSEILIHREMKEGLEQKNLVTIHVRSSHLTWTKKGKEAIVNGNMFDVKNYTENGDQIELTGLFDNDEDKLFTEINMQQENNTDATGSTAALKWFSCFSWHPDNDPNQFFVAQNSLFPLSRQYTFIQDPVLPCDTPPPESISI
jgi:hypothetical protein